jgi:hypothetical protein
MKKTLYAVPAAAALFVVLAFLSCAMGGEPAWKADGETIIALTLPSLPRATIGAESVGSRAVVQGGGYLYVQTGITSTDAKMYGPFRATPGEPYLITTIPGGNYPYMALVYVKDPDSYLQTAPIIPSTASRSGLISELQSIWSDENETREMAAGTLLTDVDIIPNQINSISATLVPTTTNVPTTTGSISCIEYQYTRRFMKLTNVSTLFTGAYPGSENTFVCNVSSMMGGTMYAVGIYEEDGSLVAWFSDARAYASTPTPYTAPWTGHDVYYLYFEFVDSYYMVNFNFNGIVN